MPRRKSLRDIFEQMQRLTTDTSNMLPSQALRINRRNDAIRRIANRYRENMRNAISRNKLGSVGNNLDTKFDKQVYTRATAIGTDR